jgi:hypothetical protein
LLNQRRGKTSDLLDTPCDSKAVHRTSSCAIAITRMHAAMIDSGHLLGIERDAQVAPRVGRQPCRVEIPNVAPIDACRLHADGVDIRIIQPMLGHASIQQTQRYLNVTDEELCKGLEVNPDTLAKHTHRVHRSCQTATAKGDM